MIKTFTSIEGQLIPFEFYQQLLLNEEVKLLVWSRITKTYNHMVYSPSSSFKYELGVNHCTFTDEMVFSLKTQVRDGTLDEFIPISVPIPKGDVHWIRIPKFYIETFLKNPPKTNKFVDFYCNSCKISDGVTHAIKKAEQLNTMPDITAEILMMKEHNMTDYQIIEYWKNEEGITEDDLQLISKDKIYFAQVCSHSGAGLTPVDIERFFTIIYNYVNDTIDDPNEAYERAMSIL